MPCGKKPLVKSWDKPRNIRVITSSRYEQNEASVKEHWKKVTRDLELSYNDDQFLSTQSDTIRELVGPSMFQRIAKIFSLPLDATQYEAQSDISSLQPSEMFYFLTKTAASHVQSREAYSMSDYDVSVEEELQEEQSEDWSVVSSVDQSLERKKSSRIKSVGKMKSLSMTKSFARSSKSFSKFMSKTMMRSHSSKMKSTLTVSSIAESAHSSDDMKVHASSRGRKKSKPYRHAKNPHFEMLYCNESETDMIKWNSKYKKKTFEVSASDEFSKKAEIMTKMISNEFYNWWVELGNVEFKSEIRSPDDIEDLFQVWFDEHASRGLVLHPKILPCVLASIAKYVGVPKVSCPKVLNRQIGYDIHAETSPAHVMAFNSTLPQKMKHIPPRNNTEEQWHCVKIPEDLKTMACVWEEVQHLTSTKAFCSWLQQRPHLPMPKCLQVDDTAGEKKQLFVVPSDYVVKGKSSSTSTQELALPVSQFSLELKEVLSKLMNQ